MVSAPLRTSAARLRRAGILTAAALGGALMLSACGGGSPAASKTTSSVARAAATTIAPAKRSASGATASFAKYASCLRQHGVALPHRRPAGGTSSAPGGSTASSATAPGRFGALGSNPKFAAAAKACAGLRPTGGFGFGGAKLNSAAFASYRNCLQLHGVTLPTRPSAASKASASATNPGSTAGTGPRGVFRALNPANPKVAAALKACAPLRPNAGATAG